MLTALPSALSRASTRLVVLLGDPVAHSRSPALHNAAFAACGLDYIYVACRVASSNLADAVRGLRALHVAGANVTIPHKEAIIPLLDHLDENTQGVGAVNTIVARATAEGEVPALWGYNTDVGGFLDGLAERVSALRGTEMLVWGAGGAARAVVYALLTACAPARLTLVARRPRQAEALADALAAFDTTGALSVASDTDPTTARRCALLVNTTPLGMHPHPDATPWPAPSFSPGQTVYDLVYQPEQTRLLREAAAAGATPLSGLTMFYGQAARAFTHWTEQPFPNLSADSSNYL